jgi:hypothetical protein
LSDEELASTPDAPHRPRRKAAGATSVTADPPKPVVFLSPEIAPLAHNYHPGPDRNRVYYAGSLKQARGWAKFTSIPLNLCPYNCEYDFRKYGVFVIFYKGQAAGFEAGFDPKIEFIEESAAGELSAKVDVPCYGATSCAGHQPDPSHPWGMYILVRIVKRSLLVPPKTVHVPTSA